MKKLYQEMVLNITLLFLFIYCLLIISELNRAILLTVLALAPRFAESFPNSPEQKYANIYHLLFCSYKQCRKATFRMLLSKQSGIESIVIKLPKGVSSQGKSCTVQILNLVLHSSKQKKREMQQRKQTSS